MSVPRFRLRTLMIAVAVVGTVWGVLFALTDAGGGEARPVAMVVGALLSLPVVRNAFLRDAYNQKAAHHADIERLWLDRWKALLVQARADNPHGIPSPDDPAAAACLRQAEWHGKMRRKYRFAASYPWVTVAPDPDPPTGSEDDAPTAKALEERSRQVTIRHESLGYEVTIKALGAVHGILACIVVVVVARGIAVDVANAGPRIPGLIDILIGAVSLALIATLLALSIGLRRFRPWARWGEVALGGIVFAANGVVLAVRLAFEGSQDVGWFVAVHGAAALLLLPIFHLLLSPPGARIFSPEYREVILRTSHVRVASGCVMPVLLLILGGFVFAAVIVAR